MSQKSEIFDRDLLHERRRRLARRYVEAQQAPEPEMLPDFLLQYAADDVADRLSMIKRKFQRALVIGSYHGVMAERLQAAGVGEIIETDAVREVLAMNGARRPSERVVANESDLPFEAGAFDLVVSVLALQYTNDVPGVFGEMHRLLRPDGLFIAVVLGGATLTELRQVMLQAEAEITGGASPRVMPFVDVRDAGGLLQRAGFALPVTDAETLTVTYASALDLMRELKAMGASNVLLERSRVPVTRGLLLRAAEIYAERFPADDGEGRVRAMFELVALTGWSPDPSQQQPLRPGSAEVSLADVLKPRVLKPEV